jgi:hypothetical protein
MGKTTFSGPVISENGFEGDITGDTTGDTTGTHTGAVIIPTLAIADLPDATAFTGPYIASDAADGPVLVYSNQTIWVDVLTGIEVSDT